MMKLGLERYFLTDTDSIKKYQAGKGTLVVAADYRRAPAVTTFFYY